MSSLPGSGATERWCWTRLRWWHVFNTCDNGLFIAACSRHPDIAVCAQRKYTLGSSKLKLYLKVVENLIQVADGMHGVCIRWWFWSTEYKFEWNTISKVSLCREQVKARLDSMKARHEMESSWHVALTLKKVHFCHCFERWCQRVELLCQCVELFCQCVELLCQCVELLCQCVEILCQCVALLCRCQWHEWQLYMDYSSWVNCQWRGCQK